jgi:hypothetical protein
MLSTSGFTPCKQHRQRINKNQSLKMDVSQIKGKQSLQVEVIIPMQRVREYLEPHKRLSAAHNNQRVRNEECSVNWV